MRRVYLIILLSAIFSLKGMAQFNVYHPFPDSNAYWREEAFNGSSGFGFTVQGYGYKLAGDTVIKGMAYHKVNEIGGYQTFLPSGEAFYNIDFYYAAIREDTLKHIYMYDTTIHRDTLLYDFNIKIGDTLNQYNSPGWSGRKAVVTKIDSIFIGSSYRKQFVLGFDSIIEGIGSTEGLFDGIVPPFEIYSLLDCFSQNNDMIYSSSILGPHDSCSKLYLGVNSLSGPKGQFSVYPNPASMNVTISYLLPQGQNNAVLRLYNTMGQIEYSKNMNSTNSTINENVSGIPCGVYYYTLSVNGLVTAGNKLVIVR